MNRLIAISYGTLFLLPATCVAAPSDSPPAQTASITEIPFSTPLIASEFKEKIDALKTGGLFRDLQFIVTGNTVAIVGETTVVQREINSLKQIAQLIERGAQNAASANALTSAEVVMSDARSASQLKQKLDTFKAPRGPQKIPGLFDGLEFLPSGNILLVVGDESSILRDIDTIRRIGFFFERPRAHLQLNLRVVQISGRDKSEVTQMAEAVRNMVEVQRFEIVYTFGLLQQYVERMPRNDLDGGSSSSLQATIASLFAPANVANDGKLMSLPEMLVRLALHRAVQHERQSSELMDVSNLSFNAFAAMAEDGHIPSVQDDELLGFPARLKTLLLRTPSLDIETLHDIQEDLDRWIRRVVSVRDEVQQFQTRIERDGRDVASVVRIVNALDESQEELPIWIKAAIRRSILETARSFPAVARDHAIRSVREVSKRYTTVTTRGEEVATTLQRAAVAFANARNTEAKDEAEGAVRTILSDVRTLADSLVPPPLALFQDIDISLDAFSPPAIQLAGLFQEYARERMKIESNPERNRGIHGAGTTVNYARLQSLESRINRWLRRISEVTGRSLEEQFYHKYVKDIRLLADKRLNSNFVLSDVSIERIPDVTRDMLLAQRTVNVFISNSISLQFAQDTQNSVSATVQAALPTRSTLAERLASAQQASTQIEAISKAVPDLNVSPIIESLLSGGAAVEVKGGLTLQATPTVGYDAGSVTLLLSATQTLDPAASGNIADRVSRHEVTNSTINALSYEPMVLSTLTSDITYYDEVGGIPGIRKTPIVGKILNDLPGPLKRRKRQQGVFQASVIILEPVVIPTIEDLMNDSRGWRNASADSGSGLSRIR